jgi:hypothetical protein
MEILCFFMELWFWARPLCTKRLFVFFFVKGGGGGGGGGRAAGKIGQVLEFFSSESGSAQLWD